MTTQIICDDLGSCREVNTTLVKQILVPFDNSNHAPRVFGYALTLAKKFGSSITVVSITQKDISRSWINETPGREKGMSLDSFGLLEEGIKELKEQAERFHIPFESTIITSREVCESLISLITTKRIDLVVMGTRGKGMSKEMMMGRVSTALGLNSPCPVLLVK